MKPITVQQYKEDLHETGTAVEVITPDNKVATVVKKKGNLPPINQPCVTHPMFMVMIGKGSFITRYKSNAIEYIEEH